VTLTVSGARSTARARSVTYTAPQGWRLLVTPPAWRRVEFGNCRSLYSTFPVV
jgi:hypothetical protein